MPSSSSEKQQQALRHFANELEALADECLHNERRLGDQCDSVMLSPPRGGSQRDARLMAMAEEIEALAEQYSLNEDIYKRHSTAVYGAAGARSVEREQQLLAKAFELERMVEECRGSFDGMDVQHDRRNRLLLDKLRHLLHE